MNIFGNGQLLFGFVVCYGTCQLFTSAAVVAEWLRRWTRNPMGSPRTGSNPVGSEYFFQNILRLFPVANVTKVEKYE